MGAIIMPATAPIGRRETPPERQHSLDANPAPGGSTRDCPPRARSARPSDVKRKNTYRTASIASVIAMTPISCDPM